MIRKVTIALILVAFIQQMDAQYNIPAKMSWWYEARFGMFVHFGSYSYLGHGEWAFSNERWTKGNYQTRVSAKFNPADFNAGTIARLAKNAGMKYLVITAKHHEGFCMWPTAVQSFKDTTGTKLYTLKDYTPFGSRDILRELKDSCDAAGVKFCLYYSILDWNHPSQVLYRNPSNHWDVFSTMASMQARTDYINDMRAQLKELINRYHPYVLWFDGDWTHNTGAPVLEGKWWTKNDGIALYDSLVKWAPNLIVNERVFRDAGLGDFQCPEQTIPAKPETRPWETCQTMNGSWGYASWDHDYKSTTTLIHQLVQVVSRDGNYLLNIGPKGDGTVPEETVTLLDSIGSWMNTNSESIYGATRSPFGTEPAWGYYTRKTGKLYAHVFTWPSQSAPANGQLQIPSLKNTINRVYLLSAPDNPLSYTVSAGYINIKLPAIAPDTMDAVIVVDVQGNPEPASAVTSVNDQKMTGPGYGAVQ